MNAEPRDREAAYGSHGREQQCLRKDLPREIPPTGTDSRTNGEFVLTERSSHQQEVGHIGAGNEQKKDDCAHERENGRADFGDEMLPHGLHADRVSGSIFDCEILPRIGGYLIDCGLCPPRRESRSPVSDYAHSDTTFVRALPTAP